MLTKNKQQPTEERSLQGQYAGFATRFLAYIIDTLIIVTTLVGMILVYSLLATVFNFDDVIRSWIEPILANETVSTIIRWLTAVGLITVVAFLYHTTFWAVTGGKSLGKALVGVRIVRFDGHPITLLRAWRRYITFWLAAIPFFIGLLWVLIDDRRQGWHDKLSFTCVIYDWPAKENVTQLEALQTRWHYLKSSRKRVSRKAKKEAEKLGVTKQAQN